MAYFYIFALLPVIIGLIIWLKNKTVTWWEYAISSGAGFIVAGIMHWAAVSGMIDDTETWSGKVYQTIYSPEWVERWIEHHSESYECGTKDNPRTCTRHWTTVEYDTHHEHWTVLVDFGIEQTAWEVNQQTYDLITKEFGGRIESGPLQDFNHGGTYYSGNRNTYIKNNHTGFVCPVTQLKSFENRVKASPSVFSFIQVPTNVMVYPYPKNQNCWQSDRLLGRARQDIDIFALDQLNARLGPDKKVNVIIIGFNGDDTSLFEYQRAKFLGGKKNDLVICYSDTKAKCFGWSDSEICKRNIETLFLQNKIDNTILSLLEKEIRLNYKIKEWKDFDYLSIEPQTRHFVWFFIIMGLTQVGVWAFALLNDMDCEFRNVYNKSFKRY